VMQLTSYPSGFPPDKLSAIAWPHHRKCCTTALSDPEVIQYYLHILFL
jgi:hypothetical protein